MDDHQDRLDRPKQGVSPLAVILPILVLLVLVTLWRSQKSPENLPPPVPAGTLWPAFEADGWLNLAEGETFQLDPAGKVLVVDCMASWCGPCLREMPKLVKLADQYRPLGVEFVSLSQETERDIPKLEDFLAASPGADWPFGYGAYDLFNTLPINFFPSYLLLVDGKVVWSGFTLENLSEELDAALAAK